MSKKRGIKPRKKKVDRWRDKNRGSIYTIHDRFQDIVNPKRYDNISLERVMLSGPPVLPWNEPKFQI